MQKFDNLKLSSINHVILSTNSKILFVHSVSQDEAKAEDKIRK